MSCLYAMDELTCVEQISSAVYILAWGEDERTKAVTNTLACGKNNISEIILIEYEDSKSDYIHQLFPGSLIHKIRISKNISDFISAIRTLTETFLNKDILMDITAIRIPEMFALMKYLKVCGHSAELHIAYSTPVEYEFQTEPFTSYHSYYGNLRTADIAGFGGVSADMSYSQMIIFLGFEGVLSTKINEDIKYEKLVLVNNLPSFYEKYKDISVINNYDLLGTRHEKMSYVPANNPFETYNYLCEQLNGHEPACAAPLSTKPVALGVCLYGLSHEFLRVVYPMADEYNLHRANSVHKTYLYTIDLCKL